MRRARKTTRLDFTGRTEPKAEKAERPRKRRPIRYPRATHPRGGLFDTESIQWAPKF